MRRQKLRTGSIQYFQHALLTINFYLFSIRIFNRGIVFLHKNRLYKLNGLEKQRRQHHAPEKTENNILQRRMRSSRAPKIFNFHSI